MSDHSPNTGKSPELTLRLGLSIDESCKVSNIGRTKIYQAIGSGELIAKKCGSRTIILPKHLEAYLESLPVADFASGRPSSAEPPHSQQDARREVQSRRAFSRAFDDTSTHEGEDECLLPHPPRAV